MGTFCCGCEGEDLLVDRFKGCELVSTVDVVELPLMVPLVSTALRAAAASAKECSLESSSGWVGGSFGVIIVTPVFAEIDLDEETPRITVCE